MKKIKPVVLKDATKLTNKEMKKIRGGWYENSSSTICSATCESGASKEFVLMDCSNITKATCAISYEGYETIATCLDMYGNDLHIEERCGNPLPPVGV